jgi:hypothetical protein
MLITMISPIGIVYCCWVISGDQAVAAKALGLPVGAPSWLRIAGLVLTACQLLCFWLAARLQERRRFLFVGLGVLTGIALWPLTKGLCFLAAIAFASALAEISLGLATSLFFFVFLLCLAVVGNFVGTLGKGVEYFLLDVMSLCVFHPVENALNSHGMRLMHCRTLTPLLFRYADCSRFCT